MPKVGERGVSKWLSAHRAHGILYPEEIVKLKSGEARVYELMKDGLWHTAVSIRFIAGEGIPATEGLRRMRDLRTKGIIIVKRRVRETRLFEYKIQGRTKE